MYKGRQRASINIQHQRINASVCQVKSNRPKNDKGFLQSGLRCIVDLKNTFILFIWLVAQ